MKSLKTESSLTVKLTTICLPIFGLFFTFAALAKAPVSSRTFSESYYKNVPEEELILQPNFLRKTFGKILGHDSRFVCCRPVKLSPKPVGLIPHSEKDPYIAGETAYTLESSNHSQLFQWSRPEKISGLKIYSLK